VKTWCELLLREHSIICGKWNGIRYKVVRLLGKGANGTVYLVTRERDERRVALKIATDSLTLQSEINVLRSLRFVDRSQYVLDSDDVELAGHVHGFYVMKWIDGTDWFTFLKRSGRDWLAPLGSQLLQQLHALHQQGYVFADLKGENVLVGRHGKLELIDYGGVTPFGRSLRQYTERMDRGYWRAGDRTADPQYDLFAFAIICIDFLASSAFAKLTAKPYEARSPDSLLHIVQTEPAIYPIRSILRKILLGEYRSAQTVLDDWQSVHRRHVLLPIARSYTKWLKITFACSILLFICTIIYVIPK